MTSAPAGLCSAAHVLLSSGSRDNFMTPFQAGGHALGAASDEKPADTNFRSGRVSERATMVKMSRTRSSSSNVTRLVTSRPVLALVLDVFASVEMLPRSEER